MDTIVTTEILNELEPLHLSVLQVEQYLTFFSTMVQTSSSVAHSLNTLWPTIQQT